MQITIDAELKALIPALTSEEFAQLEANIVQDGRIINPLVVWKTDGKTILIDGHNRYKLSEKLKMSFETTEKKLADREAAGLWIEEHQMGTRNLNPTQYAVMVESIATRREKAARKAAATKAGQDKPLKNQKDNVAHDVTSDVIPKQTKTLRTTAKEFKAPQRSVVAIRQIKEKAPELIAKMRSGEITLAQAKTEALKEDTKKFKAERSQEVNVPSLSQFISQANTFFIVLDTKLNSAIKDIKAVPTLPPGLMISGRELVKILKKISTHAAEYADKLESAMRR